MGTRVARYHHRSGVSTTHCPKCGWRGRRARLFTGGWPMCPNGCEVQVIPARAKEERRAAQARRDFMELEGTHPCAAEREPRAIPSAPSSEKDQH